MNTAQELQTVQPVDTAGGIIAVIERAALNPECDIDKMERLLSMQERILAKQAEQAYTAAMVRAQRNMPAIKKDKENKQTSSVYASLEQINKTITPIYTAEGFSLSFGTEDSGIDGYIRIVCDVLHVEGHSKRYHYDSPMDDAGIAGKVNKTPTHARASAMSYGQRYLVKLIFNLTLEGEDDDGNAAGGDTRSVMDIQNEWVEYMVCLRAHIENIAALKQHLRDESWSFAKEAWQEIPREDQMILYRAPTKGGILTTEERNKMKSNDWSAA